VLALCFFLVSVTFVWRSFYKMRIVRALAADTKAAATGK
jgi:hypothetical protein